MAHFAQLDDDNKVTQVIVVNNSELLGDLGQESESRGIAFCQTLFPGTRWVQTSYNGNFRKNYAGIGFYYDEVRDAFVPPKPFDSWMLNEETCQWNAPAPYPQDGQRYAWDEATVSWVEITGF